VNKTAPDAVAVSNDPILAEKMMCKLHHAAVSANAANSANAFIPANAVVSANAVVLAPELDVPELASPLLTASALSYVQELGRQLVSKQENTAPEISARKNDIAGDFFADAPVLIPFNRVKEQVTALSDSASVIDFASKLAPSSETGGGDSDARPALRLVEGRQELSEQNKNSAHTQQLLQRVLDAQLEGATSDDGFFNDIKSEMPKAVSRSNKNKPLAAKTNAKISDPPESKQAIPAPAKFLSAVLVGLALLAGGYLLGSARNDSGSEEKKLRSDRAGYVRPVISGTQNSSTPLMVAPSLIQGDYSYSFNGISAMHQVGKMQLLQNGSKITGSGSDESKSKINGIAGLRKFQISGSYLPPNLVLVKKYLNSPQEIVYNGSASQSANGPIQLHGNWCFSNIGRRLSASAAPQLWSASQDTNGFKENDVTAPGGNGFLDLLWPPNETPANRFLRVLAVCIVFGLAVVKLSVKFFGLHGLLSVWERENYIPHSVRRQHMKLLKELGAGKKGGLLLGARIEWRLHQFWLPKTLYLPAARRERNPHLLAMGAGAKGKTRLLASMIINDIKNDDRAIVVVDSEGSLIELITRWLGTRPEAAKVLQRVSIIDPCRPQCQIGFNPLTAGNTENLQAAASAIVMGFKAVYTESQNQQNQWTQQTANILRNAVLLLMLNERSLEHLPALLSDNDYRDVLLEKIEKEHAREWKTLLDAWSNYKRLARTEQWINWIEPILNRVQPLLSDQRISRLLNEKDNCLDLSQLLAEKRILLVRVPEGQLEKGGNLLGSLIITGLRQAGLLHFERTGDSGTPCSLYVDELNNFIDADCFEAICSDLRKVQIGIHATLKTLHDLNEEFRNKVLLNFGTMALFSVSKKDADLIGPTMFRVEGRKVKKFTPKDIFCQVSSQPTMDFASDEEKININRLVGQEERNYFCHLVGTEAGVFRIKAPEFPDIPKGDVNWDLIEKLYSSNDSDDSEEETC